MGFLDRATGADEGTGVTVAVAVEPLEVVPGGQVVVRYELSGELDDKCTALMVGLAGAGYYPTTQTSKIGRAHV